MRSDGYAKCCELCGIIGWLAVLWVVMPSLDPVSMRRGMGHASKDKEKRYESLNRCCTLMCPKRLRCAAQLTLFAQEEVLHRGAGALTCGRIADA
jgi:hypothetical protein